MQNTFDTFTIHRLAPGDDQQFSAMLDLFATVFEDRENYSSARPGPKYRQALLGRDDIIALVALTGEGVIGALVAYELRKFEQERSEFYLYDLAVAGQWRRRGVATALIDALKGTLDAENRAGPGTVAAVETLVRDLAQGVRSAAAGA